MFGKIGVRPTRCSFLIFSKVVGLLWSSSLLVCVVLFGAAFILCMYRLCKVRLRWLCDYISGKNCHSVNRCSLRNKTIFKFSYFPLWFRRYYFDSDCTSSWSLFSLRYWQTLEINNFYLEIVMFTNDHFYCRENLSILHRRVKVMNTYVSCPDIGCENLVSLVQV